MSRLQSGTKIHTLVYITTLMINLVLMCMLKFTSLTASLGISFYALSMIGYLTDCYWGMCDREKNIAKVMLFNIYFPQLISGPVLRFGRVSPSLFAIHPFDRIKVRKGIIRIIIGFFKKLLVSEHLSALTNFLFSNYETYDGVYVWIGTILYVIELYADFSGCMDIVLGASECFGVELPENFNSPFRAVTIQEIWQRWHITLGTFLKDFVMYPILRSKLFTKMTPAIKDKWGKKAAKNIPTFLAMLVLWLCMGIWHGFGLNFVGEGLWFWLIIVISTLLNKTFKKWRDAVHIDAKSSIYVFFCRARTAFLFGIGMLFFKANGLTAAFKMLGSAFNPKRLSGSVATIKDSLITLESTIGANNIFTPALSVVLGVIFMCIKSSMDEGDAPMIDQIAARGYKTRFMILYIMVIMILMLGAYGPGFSASEFIYGGF